MIKEPSPPLPDEGKEGREGKGQTCRQAGLTIFPQKTSCLIENLAFKVQGILLLSRNAWKATCSLSALSLSDSF